MLYYSGAMLFLFGQQWQQKLEQKLFLQLFKVAEMMNQANQCRNWTVSKSTQLMPSQSILCPFKHSMLEKSITCVLWGALNEMFAPCLRHLNTWFQLAAWGGLGGVALMEKCGHCQLWDLIKTLPLAIPDSLSAFWLLPNFSAMRMVGSFWNPKPQINSSLL